MRHRLLGSLIGAGAGYLLGFVAVAIMSGGQPPHDAAAIILFVGSFLAGTGAIAGAVIGGGADRPLSRRAVDEEQSS